MERPTLHRATDRRCYNEAMCSNLQREVDSEKEILRQLKKVEPEFSCTYFPMEKKYLTFIKYRTLTDNFHSSLGEAILEAWDLITGEKNVLPSRN